MRNRPWGLVLLAGVQILTPVFNIFFNAFALKVSVGAVFTWWLARPPLELFESFVLMPLAGYAIYQMKRWSYFVFFGAWLWSLLGNLRYWDYAVSSVPTLIWIALAVGNVALVSYVLLPAVRRTFFDPSVRWWEASTRFEVEMQVEIQAAGVSKTGQLLNFSEGGAFIRLEEPLGDLSEFELSLEILSMVVTVPARIVYSRPGSDGEGFYGVQYMHSAESRRQFQAIAEGLRKMGFVERNPQKGNADIVIEGVLEFFKSGKGLIPAVGQGKNPR